MLLLWSCVVVVGLSDCVVSSQLFRYHSRAPRVFICAHWLTVPGQASDEAPASGGDAKTSGGAAGGASSSGTSRAANTSGGGVKKRKPRRAGSGVSNDANNTNAASSTGTTAASVSAAQAAAVRDQMRRALEEDQYSANGSIVDTDSDSDVGGGGGMVEYHGTVLRIDRPSLMQYAKEYMSLLGGGAGSAGQADGSHSASAAGGIGTGTALSASASGGAASKKGKDKGTRASNASSTGLVGASAPTLAAAGGGTASDSVTKELDDELDLDGGSIFGQTTGSSNFTWYVHASETVLAFPVPRIDDSVSHSFCPRHSHSDHLGSAATAARSGAACGVSWTRRSSRPSGTAA